MRTIRIVLIGTLLVLLQVAGAQAFLPLDHFMCYKTRTSLGIAAFKPVADVNFRDQFEQMNVTVGAPIDLCNPADKNGEGIFDPDTHLRTYKIKPGRATPKPIVRESHVTDQFHASPLHVKTSRAKFMMVPSHKALGGQVPQPPIFGLHVVDHFLCYKASPLPGTKFDLIANVSITDQFNQLKLYNLKPKYLCNPADKLWLGRLEQRFLPQRHLLCYSARPAKGQPKHQTMYYVGVSNQFGPEFFGSEFVDTVREDIFCIPAEKTLVVPPPSCPDGVVNQASEQCDPPDDAWCPGMCNQADCTCPATPFCGDGVVNQLSEQCDPPGSACAGGFGVCSTNCKCNETDIFPATVARVEIEFSPGQTETIDLQGPTTVDVQLGGIGDHNGNGREEVETEMLELRLTGMSRTLGPVQVRLNSTMPSRGTIEERINNTVATLDLPPLASDGTADSFFDVFFEIEVGHIPGMVLHNNDPKRMATTITRKPPATGETYEDPTPIELYNSNGQPTGIRMLGARHVPTPAPPVCDNGVWDLGEVCDLSANVWWCWLPSGLESTCLPNCTCYGSVIGG